MTEQTPEQTAESKPKLTVTESIELLNGYDELRIQKHFGAPPIKLDDAEVSLRGVMLFRALLFASAMRGGLSEPEALDVAMKPNATKVLEEFGADTGTEGDEGDDEGIDPDTESGKGDSGDS